MSKRLLYGVYKRDNEQKPWRVQLPMTPNKPVYIGIYATLNEALAARDGARNHPGGPAAWLEERDAQRMTVLSARDASHRASPQARAAATRAETKHEQEAKIPPGLRPYIQLVRAGYKLSLPFNDRLRTIGTYPTIAAAIVGAQHGKSLLCDIAQRARRAALAQLAGQGDPDAERLINDPRYDYEDLPLEPEPALKEALATIDQLAQELPHVP